MHCVTNIHEDLYWLGGSDRQLAKFENVFPIPRGVSYNAYLVLDFSVCIAFFYTGTAGTKHTVTLRLWPFFV